MKTSEFIAMAKNAKEVTFIKDESKRDFIGVWNTDIQVWSKNKNTLEALGGKCPNTYDIEYMDNGEYMMQVYSTAKPIDE